MAKLKKLLAELNELNKFEDNLIQRLWEKSEEAVDLEGTALTQKNIKDRIDALALQITKDFPNESPVIVGLMDGAVPFAALLCDALGRLNYSYNYTTMTVSSYGNEMVSGSLHIGALPKVNLFLKNVIVVDDVCDSGKTLKGVRGALLTQHPKQLKLMTLVDKVQDRPNGCNPDYAGFSLSKDAFIIGMGLDYRHDLRDKTCIKTANPDYLPTAEEQLKFDRKDEVIRLIKELDVLKQKTKLAAPVQNGIFTRENTTDDRNIFVAAYNNPI